MRKTRQAFPSLEQSLSHARGRLWVEIDDVIIGAPEPAQSGTGPNDAHAYASGGGTFSPLASFRSHARTRLCGTNRPAA